MSESTEPDRYASPGQQTLIKVLEALGAQPFAGVSLAELVERTGAGRDACFRAAKNLELAGWAEAAPGGGWRVTPHATYLSNRVRVALDDLGVRYLGADR